MRLSGEVVFGNSGLSLLTRETPSKAIRFCVLSLCMYIYNIYSGGICHKLFEYCLPDIAEVLEKQTRISTCVSNVSPVIVPGLNRIMVIAGISVIIMKSWCAELCVMMRKAESLSS